MFRLSTMVDDIEGTCTWHRVMCTYKCVRALILVDFIMCIFFLLGATWNFVLLREVKICCADKSHAQGQTDISNESVRAITKLYTHTDTYWYYADFISIRHAVWKTMRYLSASLWSVRLLNCNVQQNLLSVATVMTGHPSLKTIM